VSGVCSIELLAGSAAIADRNTPVAKPLQLGRGLVIDISCWSDRKYIALTATLRV